MGVTYTRREREREREREKERKKEGGEKNPAAGEVFTVAVCC